MADREKLINELANDIAFHCPDMVENGCGVYNCASCLAERLADDGYHKAVQEWISVKDRLPEEEGLYLVAVVNDHERRYSKTAWYHGCGNWFSRQDVTHWMPLPEPPKGE